MENYQCHIMIDNRSSEHLRLLKQDIPWGTFHVGPEKDVRPHTSTKAFVASGITGPAGTEGTVVYQVGDDANVTISIYFEIPTRPMSSNTVRVDSSNPDIAAQMSGFNGSGSTEVCEIKVIDGRANG